MSAQTLVEITCSECNSKYKIPHDYVGKRGTCKNCGIHFKMAPQPVAQDIPLIGKLAVKYKFIEKAQLETLLPLLDHAHRDVTCEKLLVEKGFISSKQLSLLKSVRKYINLRQQDRQFSSILLKKKLCDPPKIDEAFDVQAKLFQESRVIKALGDILIEQGHLSSEQRDSAMIDEVIEEATEIDSGENKEALFLLNIPEDGLSAYLELSRHVKHKITVDEICRFIEAKGISNGVADKKDIEAYVKSVSAKKKPLKIAEGTQPVPSKDGDIRFYIDLDSVVKAGDLVAEKVSAVCGKPGVDVFGNAITVPEPKEMTMQCGKGVTLSEDGLKVYAERDGIPYISLNNNISILSEITIAGDVDHTIGDIHFPGPITVTGTVKKGCYIKGNSLTANEIRGADVDINGEINVSRGILDASIKAKGDIHALFVKGTEIIAYGDLIVAKEIINSKIEISGECNIQDGKIISSSITAWKGILVYDVGTELANASTLSPGVDAHIEKETSEILKALDEKKGRYKELKSRLEKLEKTNNKLNDEIVEYAQVQDQSMLEQRALLEQLDTLKKNGDTQALEEVETALQTITAKAREAETSVSELFVEQEKISKEIADATAEFDSMGEERKKLKDALNQLQQWSSEQKGIPVVKVFGSVMDGTILAGAQSSKTLIKIYKNVELIERKSKVPSPDDRWEIRVMSRKKEEK